MNQVKTFYLETFGCQMNVHDSEKVIGTLLGQGYSQVPTPEEADLVFYNTCSIREKAEQKVFSRLQQFKKEHGKGKTFAVLGCVAQQEGEKIFEKAPHVSLVCGSASYNSLPQLLVQLEAGNRRVTGLSLDTEDTFETPFARIGILICYDRHFPEAARVLGLGGAEILFVPTATTRMTRYLWDVELRAHAIANVFYVCGVNKVGVDVGGSRRDHHGNSMILSPKGEVMAEASATEDDIALADIDLATLPSLRKLWGYYRDRRPDKYAPVVEEPSGRIDPAVARPVAAR